MVRVASDRLRRPPRRRHGPKTPPNLRPPCPPTGRPQRKEHPLALARNPSYLKRQKEQQRLARAAQKREARLARKHSKTSQTGEDLEPLDAPTGESEMAGDAAEDAGEDPATG